jgi:hypothetical protein
VFTVDTAGRSDGELCVSAVGAAGKELDCVISASGRSRLELAMSSWSCASRSSRRERASSFVWGCGCDVAGVAFVGCVVGRAWSSRVRFASGGAVVVEGWRGVVVVVDSVVGGSKGRFWDADDEGARGP